MALTCSSRKHDGLQEQAPDSLLRLTVGIFCAFRGSLCTSRSERSVASVSVETRVDLLPALLSRELLDDTPCSGDGLLDREGARLFTQRKLFLSGGSDSKRHFFGDFLCASTAPQERREQRSWPRRGAGQDARSQESYPLLRRRSGSSALLRQSAASTGSKESYPLAEGQRKLWLQETT